MRVSDSLDADALVLRAWAVAVHESLRGEHAQIHRLLDALDLPDFARAYLRDAVAGAVQRPRGRPNRLHPDAERAVAYRVMHAWDRLVRRCPACTRPREVAIAYVARRRRWSADRVRGVVERVAAAGLTREAWIAHIRDPWTRLRRTR